MISSRVEPWICGPSAVARALAAPVLDDEARSARPRRSTKITPVKIETKMNASWMRCAFGEWASPGQEPAVARVGGDRRQRGRRVLVARVAKSDTAHAGWHRIERGIGGSDQRSQVELPAARRRSLRGVRERRAAGSAGSTTTRSGGTLVFERELAEEGRLGFWRWLSLFLGVAGTYRKNDTVDVVYTLGRPADGREPARDAASGGRPDELRVELGRLVGATRRGSPRRSSARGAATAGRPSTRSAPRARCGSLGELERRLVQALGVAADVAGGTSRPAAGRGRPSRRRASASAAASSRAWAT